MGRTARAAVRGLTQAAAPGLSTAGWLIQTTDPLSAGQISIPVANLLLIVVGMPLMAMTGGWLLAGREPGAIDRRPLGSGPEPAP